MLLIRHPGLEAQVNRLSTSLTMSRLLSIVIQFFLIQHTKKDSPCDGNTQGKAGSAVLCNVPTTLSCGQGLKQSGLFCLRQLISHHDFGRTLQAGFPVCQAWLDSIAEPEKTLCAVLQYRASMTSGSAQSMRWCTESRRSSSCRDGLRPSRTLSTSLRTASRSWAPWQPLRKLRTDPLLRMRMASLRQRRKCPQLWPLPGL